MDEVKMPEPAEAQAQGGVEVRAWMRRWAFDGVDVMALPKKERPSGWQLWSITDAKCLDDDVPLYTAPPSAPVGVEEMQRRLDREESDHGRTIDQRDAAEDALGRMFQAVTGRPAEWSSAWGYVDAIEEVEEHVAALAQQPAAVDVEK